jgi:hypothetical protein
MSVNPRRLGRHISPDTQSSSAQAIDELAGHQIEIGTQAHQQRIGKFNQRRDDELITRGHATIKQLPPQSFKSHGPLGQQLVNTVG